MLTLMFEAVKLAQVLQVWVSRLEGAFVDAVSFSPRKSNQLQQQKRQLLKLLPKLVFPYYSRFITTLSYTLIC